MGNLSQMVWNGSPEHVLEIAETLDTEQRHTWAFQLGKLWIGNRSFEAGDEITLEGDGD